ncbi:MAG: HU family DNA-binding protein [Solobacterium sp.]|jgi:DNA-binding protein HU-beta|nr:HU family DNA-binding protein [Solobacterium sp.]MCH4205016.1 HU family DNA-binding protein [Solobacterium sp.]MCH4226525.1 HU family DNA-binding protein [Solobacterium sp.]MCH4281809.1 HU family DNA-binding protein [Solobacterium sp.]NLH63044.1 HU family DNA-binding protein [Erysipelotrichaceae bacterium]
MELTNKKSISETIAEKHDLTKKEAGDIVDLVFDTISDTLKNGGRVDITGFGKFEVKTRAARTGINPQTKAAISIPETKVPGFKASKVLKDIVK